MAACAGGAATPESVTDRDTAVACRQQANTTYAMQNRDQIYRIRDPFTPQSSTGLTDLPSRGLSDSFAQQQMIQNCIRNTGTEGTPGSPAAAPGAGAPSGGLPPSGSLSR